MDVLEFFDFTQTQIDIVPATLDYFRVRVSEVLGADAAVPDQRPGE